MRSDWETSYSFATYDRHDDHTTYGHIVKFGMNWDLWRRIGLRAFDGFYYIDGGGADRYGCGSLLSILLGRSERVSREERCARSRR